MIKKILKKIYFAIFYPILKAILKPLIDTIHTESYSKDSTTWGVELLLRREILPKYEILSPIDSIRHIITADKSFVRFGDGEMMSLSRKAGGMHSLNPNLTAQLAQSLQNAYDLRLPIGLFPTICARYDENITRENLYAAERLKVFEVLKYIHTDYVYFDALILRYAPIDYFKIQDSSFDFRTIEAQIAQNPRFYTDTPLGREMLESYCDTLVKPLKNLWRDKRIIVIEGYNSYFGVYNDLLDTARSIERINNLPSYNAFRALESTKTKALKLASKYDKNNLIFLLALGQSAKILTIFLTQNGFKAFDVGNFSISYDCILQGKDRGLIDTLNTKRKYVLMR